MCACVLSLAPSPHVYVRLGGIPLLLSLTLFLLIPPYKLPTTAHIASLCDPLSVCLTTYIRMLYESQIINPNHDLCPCDMCSYAFGRTVRTSAGGWTAASTFSRVSEAPVPVSQDEIGSRRRQPPPPEDHGSSHGSTVHYCSVYIPRIRFSLRNGKYRRSELYGLYRCGGSKGKGEL